MLPMQKAVAILMSFLLVLTTFPVGAFAQNASPSGTQNAPASGTGEESQPLSSDELDGLVAPIALYPDALVAQILGAATFPYEIVDATLWLKDNPELKGEALAKQVDQQSWDPAVKALTQFPSVLDNLAKNLAWTSSLGEASATQQSDVMAAVQRMRAKAQAAGNLKSTPEIKVVQQTPQTIVIQPANPQVVYVPVYNPAVIYGTPYVYPGYVYVAPPPSTAAMPTLTSTCNATPARTTKAAVRNVSSPSRPTRPRGGRGRVAALGRLGRGRSHVRDRLSADGYR